MRETSLYLCSRQSNILKDDSFAVSYYSLLAPRNQFAKRILNLVGVFTGHILYHF